LEKRISFYAESEAPIRLEGVLHLPEGGGPGAPLAILCHPHPVGGGSMDVSLITVLARDLAEAGFAALRFNFRGVGGSSGISSGGVSETEDVQGIVRWLDEQDELSPSHVLLAGWSFGSWVGLRWALETGLPERVALVSPPLVGFDFFSFLGAKPPRPEMGKLIVVGERDQFSDPLKIDELGSRLGAGVEVLPGADHFLFGRESLVARHVITFFSI
jgi:hypothetical protein